ncbi:MAG: cytochrome c [Burkholderiales bacterium]|nr:cytochrome c [Burkholderiales bacterium]
MRALKLATSWLVGALLVLLVAAYAVFTLNQIDEAPLSDAADLPASGEVVARGAYLARIGDCASCHTRAGGLPYAGGRAIETPFGAVYASNLTPDPATGLGRWSADEFWRALHNGRSRDGRLLYPAFPYPDYTHVTRGDADAIFAYLRTLDPVRAQTPAAALRFPYDTQAALAVWRALYFRPASWAEQPRESPEWNRGAYLVQGLGHCAACHTPRDALGGPRRGVPLTGGVVPGDPWWAPSLVSAGQAGVANWPLPEVVALLTTGVTAHAGVSGPMAEVVFASLQYLNADDARAMAVYLRSLPAEPEPTREARPAPAPVLERGQQIYADRCAQCHGDEGEGKAGAFPALAGNRAVRMSETLNLIQMVLHGGYQPATAGHPRPYGMPPFRQSLSEADVAAVLSYVRDAWGNGAGRVETMDVHRARERPGS